MCDLQYKAEHEWEYGLKRRANDKAWGLNGLTGELFKFEDLNNRIVKKLKTTFSNYLVRGYVPKYGMEARLVLINKDGTSYSPIEKSMPINILPVITKLLERSILNRINKVMESNHFNVHQRGFIRGGSTIKNIEDLLELGKKHQKEVNSIKSKAAILFFNLKNEYDSFPRKLLILKLKNWNRR